MTDKTLIFILIGFLFGVYSIEAKFMMDLDKKIEKIHRILWKINFNECYKTFFEDSEDKS